MWAVAQKQPDAPDNLASVAKAAGVTRQTLYLLRDGITKEDKVRASTLFSLASALDVNAEWLLTGKKPRAESSGASQFGGLDPAILAEAEKLAEILLHIEFGIVPDALQEVPAYTRAQKTRAVAELYPAILAGHGELSGEAQRQFIRAAESRRTGGRNAAGQEGDKAGSR